ncbi:hypothetical protein AB0M36_13760 [Actinoplanes sp. NPDC051346]|uniref:hypothetical protein n=1 Tax=Actinoplanes sp. NPDC051346 TaxID=3155048 RepID=UPI00341C7D02
MNPGDVVLDPAAAHPELTTLRDALARRDWWGCRAVLDGATPGARSGLLHWAAEEEIGDFAQAVWEADARDNTAAALLGLRLIHTGWEIRSAARAQYVSRDQFERFHDYLRRAEAVLIDATARQPRDPALWVARLLTARGLSVGQAETRRRYDRLAAADPHHLPGQLQYLQSLCPKWGGSWERLHSWARESMLAAPPGALQGRLVAEAHVEHMIGLEQTDPAAYLTDATVREELYEAAHRSVWHPDFRREPGWVGAASTFAMVFAVGRDHAASAPLFAMLGDLAAEHPWRYLEDDVVSTIKRYRRAALASGAVR